MPASPSTTLHLVRTRQEGDPEGKKRAISAGAVTHGTGHRPSRDEDSARRPQHDAATLAQNLSARASQSYVRPRAPRERGSSVPKRRTEGGKEIESFPTASREAQPRLTCHDAWEDAGNAGGPLDNYETRWSQNTRRFGSRA